MVILDPAQALALRKSASGPISVAGRRGTGKSVLANAIASESARAGKTCLLIGASELLERPLGFSFVRDMHRVLSDRAQLDFEPNKSATAAVPPASAIEARIRSNPDAATAAARILEKAKKLAKSHNLTTAEIESSAAASRRHSAGTLNSLSLAVQDASRVADVLWTGNARAGRTFKDVEEAVAGRSVEVPPDDETLDLVAASDQDYHARIAKILADQHEADEERSVSQAVAGLLRPRSSDRSMSEYHKHAAFMARTISAAISMIRRHGNLKAALAASNGNEAAKAIEYFMRMRPDQGVSAAVRTFEAALQDYRHDSALLEPFVTRFGSRPLSSFGGRSTLQAEPAQPDVGKLIQLLREARYASKHLPGHLGALRASLPGPTFERILNSPIEEAPAAIWSSDNSEPRAKAAEEARQLRELFASTGFGDLFGAPDDFVQQIEQIAAETPGAADRPSGTPYSPNVLDLLLEITSLTERHVGTDWPGAVKLARTASEALAAFAASNFDVVVVDDASAFPTDAIEQIGASRATVHRLGTAEHDEAILLEIPHRQADPDVAAAATGSPNRWLGQPNSFGILVREEQGLTPSELSAAAGRLAEELRKQGCRAALFGEHAADIVIAAFDELNGADLASVAQTAEHEVVVLCRRDARPAPEPTGLAPNADVLAARNLGWTVSRSTAEGTVLEKDGRATVIVDERAVVSSLDETVADVVRRLTSLGWDPIVCWNGAERSPADLLQLLGARSRPRSADPLRKSAEEFDLKSPPPAGGPGPDCSDNPDPFGTIGDGENRDDPSGTEAVPDHETAATGVEPPVEVLTAPQAQERADALDPTERPEEFPEDDRQHPEVDAAETGDDACAPDTAADQSDATAPAIPRPQAIFRDRRGARKPSALKDTDAPQRERRAARFRQADARLRLLVDRIRKRVGLAVVLLKPEGFPEEAEIDGTSVLAFELRYDDIDQEWSNVLLDGEFRLRDGAQGLEWIRGARPFHLFAGLPGETGLMSISAAPLAGDCTIVCRARDIEAIAAAAAEAGSPELRRLADFEGVPSEWAVLGGYAPVRALTDPTEWVKPLDPGANIVIALSDGFEVRHATYAEGGAPLVRIEGMPGNCKVFIDAAPAERQEDGSWTAPGWDAPGQHRVVVVPGPSRSYNVMPDPARCDGWETWSANDDVGPLLSGSAAVCGAMVFCPDGRTVLATEPASSVIALGAQHEINFLAVRRDAPAAIAVLPFEPLFAILSSGGRRDSNKILVLDFPATAAEHKPRKFDNRWVSTIREMAARRVPVRPETPAARAAWRSITKEARRWRRVR